jgi:bifunctional enzyme CysN/CysC
VDVKRLQNHPANVLGINEIGVCTVSLSSRIAFDSFDGDPSTGGFIIIDKMTNNTSGMGFIDFPLRRSDNIHWQKLDVTRDSRSQQKGQRPRLVWFTGLSGSGKSSIANVLEKKLQAMGRHTVLLDGDNVRHGLNRDLGFTKADRVENIRRIAEVSKLMLDAGLICITSFISPFESERRMARSLLGEGEFIEVYVDTPISICEERDVKGLYVKARSGKLPNFTGISAPYEVPLDPDIRIDTTIMSVEEATDTILNYIENVT